MYMHKSSNQEGLVSILTVIMFMIFMSIFIVGFMRIMGDEQRQATDNDLSASALAAAQSGVEDAKRIILACMEGSFYSSGGNGPRCDNMMNSAGDCTRFRTNPQRTLLTTLGIDIPMAGATAGQAQVGDESFQQYYTCLTISKNSTDVVKTLVPGQSEIIPLRTTAAFDRVQISWRETTGSYSTRDASTGFDFPALGSWTGSVASTLRPPVIRAQVIPYTASIDLNTVESESDTLFLVPASTSIVGSVARTVDNRGVPGAERNIATTPIVYTCPMGVASVGYNCTITVTGFNSATRQHYLRLTSMYTENPTLVTVTPLTSAGVPVAMDGVQYVIDVTGRTNDVFRRVQTRVSPTSSAAIPEYALDTTYPVCKNIRAADVANTTYTCSYNP